MDPVRCLAPLLLALVCLLAAQPGGVAALRCWVCSSSTDVRCRDPFNRTNLHDVNCDSGRALAGYGDRAYCQKTITSISGGEQKVLRKCVFSREPLEGNCFDQPQSSDFLTVDHCSTCDTDGCNAAPGPAPAALSAATALALSAAALAAARLLR